MESRHRSSDDRSQGASPPRQSSRSPSPQLVTTPKFSEGSLNFLENLEIGDLIGQGSYGQVYVSLHMIENQEYAIKKIQLDHLDPFQYQLVQTEVANMGKVKHPGLLKLKNAFTWTTYVVMVLPLVAYTSCDKIIQNTYPNGLPELAIGTIIKDVINAVTYLHSKNIIHRTIKASHILVKESGSAVLSGFRHMLLLPHGQERMTVHNIMAEMTQYLNWLSPEMMLQDSRGFGLNSDIYSIGITICELGNGEVPYSDVSASGILVKKLEEPPPKLWDKNCLPSQENSDANPDAQADILRNSPYQRKVYSQHIKKFVSLCTIASPDTRITTDQASKCKFYTIYSKERPSATLINLPHLGPLVKCRAKSEAAGPAAQTHSLAHSSHELVEWDLH